MGVRVSELPVTSNVAVDDKLMVLDVSEGVLKTTEVDNVGGGKELTQAQYDALTPAEQASGLYYITDAGGADSAGHTIQDSTTTFTARANLKFANGVVSDDSTNDATVVNMPFVGTTAQVNAAISGGQLEDGQEVIITDDSASADANQNLASIEDGTTASKAYAVGDFIVHNGLLYKVTAAISSGGTLTPGTNISQTTAGTELSAINSDLSAITTNRFVYNGNAYQYPLRMLTVSIGAGHSQYTSQSFAPFPHGVLFAFQYSPYDGGYGGVVCSACTGLTNGSLTVWMSSSVSVSSNLTYLVFGY